MKINSKNVHELTAKSNLFREIGGFRDTSQIVLKGNYEAAGHFFTGRMKKVKYVLKMKQHLLEELKERGEEGFQKYCKHHNFHIKK
jgi:hypothetical protein